MPAQFEEQTSKEYFRALSIIHIALLIGLLAFTLVMYFSFSTIDRGDDDKSMNEIFQYLTPGKF
jgi:hypothetical protein